MGENYVFVSVPKAATHTLYAILTERFGGGQREGPYHQRCVPLGHRHKFTFTCVRDPYTRMMTVWYHSLHRPDLRRYLPPSGAESLEGFVQWLIDTQHTPKPPAMRTMSRWLSLARLDRTLHLETLERDFNALPFVKEPVALPRLELGRALEKEGAPPYPDAEACLTPPVVGLINRFCERDFERFGYERRESA